MIYISYEVSYDMGNLYVHQQQLSRRNRLSLEAVSKFIVLLIVRPVTWTTVARAEGQKPPLLQWFTVLPEYDKKARHPTQPIKTGFVKRFN